MQFVKVRMSKFVLTPGMDAAPIESGSIAYDPKSGKFIMLNRAADFIWSALSTPKTADELVKGLCATFPDVDAAAAKCDVEAFLEQLKQFALISVS